MKERSKYWDLIFKEKTDLQLGWFEEDVSQTMKYLNAITDNECQSVFLPGAGTSLLADNLVAKGKSIVLNDISTEALHTLRVRLGEVPNKLHWLCQDIATPLPANIEKVDIWIDRAVLHFLLDELEINGYFHNLRATVKVGGYVLLAEFSINGAPKCAGLTLHRYSIDEMKQRLGDEFECIQTENYTFNNPFGEPRPYIYALFKKIS